MTIEWTPIDSIRAIVDCDQSGNPTETRLCPDGKVSSNYYTRGKAGIFIWSSKIMPDGTEISSVAIKNNS